MAFDSFFKRLIGEFLTGCETQSDVPVGQLPLRVDLVVKCAQKAAKPLIPVLETHFMQINLFEYKSSHDHPQRTDLSKLLGYLGLYCAQNAIGIEEIASRLSLWYVSVKRPDYFAPLFQDQKIIATPIRGLYTLNVPMPCPYYLLVLNELDVTEENLPLLLLTTGEPLRATIHFLAAKSLPIDLKLERYLRVVSILNYKDVHEMTELQSLLPDSITENIKLAIMDVGLKEVIKAIGIEEVIKAIGIEEAIKAIGIEEVEKILHRLKKKSQISKT